MNMGAGPTCAKRRLGLRYGACRLSWSIDLPDPLVLSDYPARTAWERAGTFA